MGGHEVAHVTSATTPLPWIDSRDFRNDGIDAGEIGAGHRVTALYAR